MISADQLLCHAVGDYVLQSDWMAQNKTKAHFPAFCHALVYSLGFLVFAPSLRAWLVIFVTHFLIDRYRLARYVVWAKNFIAPKTWWKQVGNDFSPSDSKTAKQWLTWNDLSQPEIFNSEITSIVSMQRSRTLPFSACIATGYPPSTPIWLSVWLLIIGDNIMHVVINGVALKFL